MLSVFSPCFSSIIETNILMEDIRKAVNTSGTLQTAAASISGCDLVALAICFAADYFLSVLNVFIPI